MQLGTLHEKLPILYRRLSFLFWKLNIIMPIIEITKYINAGVHKLFNVLNI
jgi:hypothetical protein